MPEADQMPDDNKSIENSVDKPEDQDSSSDAYRLWDDERMKGSYYWWE